MILAVGAIVAFVLWDDHPWFAFITLVASLAIHLT